MANIYKRGEMWWGRVTKNGKEHREPLKTRSERVARERLQELVERVNAAGWGKAARITINEACHRFLSEHAPTLREKSAARYLVSLNHFDERYGDRFMDELGKAEFREFETARRTEGVTPSTVRRDLAALSSVFTFLIEHDVLDANPVGAFLKQRKNRGLKEAPPRTRYLTQAEEAAVLAECDPHILASVAFAIGTGLRMEEQFGLTWDRVDLDRNTVHIPQSLAKGHKARDVVLLPAAQEVCRRLPRHIRSNFVFCHGDGVRFRRRSRGFKAAARRAGVKDVRWHDLRRTHGCRLLQDWDWSMEMVRDQLGHASVAQTERAYAFLTVDHRRARVATIAAGGTDKNV